MSRPAGHLLTALLVIAAGFAADLRSSLTYHQPCDSLQPALPGESVHPDPQLQPGKLGKAFLIERRTANRLADPDLHGDDAWIRIGTPAFAHAGGFADPACATLTADGYLRQVVTALPTGTLFCLSVYAQSADGGALELAAKCGGAKPSVRSAPLTAEWQRVKLAFTSDADVATVTFRAASGSVVIDAAQLEDGKSFPSSFWPQSTLRGAEWLDLPPAVVDPMRGSLAFWLQPEWLGDEESSGGLGLFGAWADVDRGYSAGKSWMVLQAYHHPGKVGWENGLSVHLKDRDGKQFGFTPLEWSAAQKPGDWLHLAFAWELHPGGESRVTAWLNGQKLRSETFRLGVIDPPKQVRLGYVWGAYADGLLDEVYLFNRPLADAEAAELAGQ